MPLKLDFKAGDKMVINGAVLENIGPNAKILVHNDSAILREKEILSVADTKTPAARVYFSLQCAYMFPDKKDEYLKVFEQFLEEYVAACPSAGKIAEEVRSGIGEGRIYKGLKAAHKLIRHERDLLDSLNMEVRQASKPADSGAEAE